MADVFLSYRNTPERRAFVKRLALLLRAHEVTVWWDYGLEAGESYRAQITDELSKALVVAPLWCSESIASKWVKMEAELGKDKLVPARLQKVVPPQEFEAIQAADLTGWDGSVQHPRVLAFVTKICERLGKSGRAPIDMMEELSELRTLEPLPVFVTSIVAATTITGQDVVLADLRATWIAFPARDSSAAIEKFLARVRGTAPGSGLEFEVEHALDVMRDETDRRDYAIRTAAEAVRREMEAKAAEQAEVVRRLTPGAEFRDAEGLPLMVTLPPGTFLMGSSEAEEGSFGNERPQRTVLIDYVLAVGKYPVTVGEWRRFVDATGRDTDNNTRVVNGPEQQEKLGKGWRNPGFVQDDQHPITCVCWDDAKDYVAWASLQSGHAYRLLSESEWEYACRANTNTSYAFGDTLLPSHANFDGVYGGTTTANKFPANAFGLHDMHGNVWEWVEDCYADTYLAGQPSDGSEFTTDSAAYRVFRGGSWVNAVPGLRSAYRNRRSSAFRNDYLGFRVARSFSTP